MEIKKIFVVGAGAMGAGIAQVAITKGYEVVLNDIAEEFVNKGKNGIVKSFTKNVEKGKMTQADMDAALGRLSTSIDYSPAADADLVIEAIFENIEVKKSIFAEIDKIAKEGAILASNTSSLSVTAISSVVKNPGNFIGIHFFNPVPAMKLLELVVGINTDPEVVKIAQDFGASMGKTVVTAKDSPGFIVNRCLVPMLNEAAFLYAEGVASAADIDTGMRFGANHPMGPLELSDMIGLDIVLAVMEAFYRDFSDCKYRPAPILKKLVSAGNLGMKSGKGFYKYEGGKKI